MRRKKKDQDKRVQGQLSKRNLGQDVTFTSYGRRASRTPWEK